MAYFHIHKIPSLFHIITIITFLQNGATKEKNKNDDPCDSVVINGQIIVNCTKRNLHFVPSGLDKDMASLDLSHNELREIRRDIMRKYQKLDNITVIARSKVPAFPCKIDADAFLDLKLILLDLEFGRFLFLHKPIFPQSLKILKLIGISLSSKMLDFTNLKNLEELFLQNNVLTDVPLLYNKAPLHILNLKDNPIGRIPPLYLARYCKLKTFIFEFTEDSLIYENYCVCTQIRDWIRLRNLLGTKPTPLGCNENTSIINCTPGITNSMQNTYYECLRFYKEPEPFDNSFLIQFITMGILLFLITIFFTASMVIFMILNNEVVQPNGTSAEAVDRRSSQRDSELRNDDNYVIEEEES